MKSYKQMMQEAVSATRLAQLAAKGKGQAAAEKMKADGLTPPGGSNKPAPKPNKSSAVSNTIMPSKPRAVGYGQQRKPQGSQEKSRRLNQMGAGKGSALAKRPTTRAVEPGGALTKSTSRLSTRPADKGGALVRGKNYKEPNKKERMGYKIPKQPSKTYPNTPRTGIKTTPKDTTNKRVPRSSSIKPYNKDKYDDAAKNRKRILDNKLSGREKRGMKSIGKGFFDSMKDKAPKNVDGKVNKLSTQGPSLR